MQHVTAYSKTTIGVIFKTQLDYVTDKVDVERIRPCRSGTDWEDVERGEGTLEDSEGRFNTFVQHGLQEWTKSSQEHDRHKKDLTDSDFLNGDNDACGYMLKYKPELHNLDEG